MPTPAAPFPHLDALQSVLARAAGAAAPTPERLGRALFPQPFVTAGTLMWPWHLAYGVLHEWARWSRELPHDATSVVRIARIPHLPGMPSELRGRPMIAVEVAIPREPWIAAGRLAALRRLEPVIDTIAVTDPDAIHPLHTSNLVPAPAHGIHIGLDALPSSAIDAFLAIAGPSSGANLLSAAIGNFGPAYAVNAFGLPVDEEDAAALEIRLELIRSRMLPYSAGRPAVETILRAVQRAGALHRGVG